VQLELASQEEDKEMPRIHDDNDSTVAADEQHYPNWTLVRTALSKPFSEDEVGQVPIDRSGRLMGKYITARSVMDRLDEVVGPGNWSDDYEKWDDETCAVKCTLTIFGVVRSDVGYPNDPSDADNAKREPFKAACSDALKRAAVHWGVGRYLYPKPGERGVSSDGAARSSKPATEKQVKFLKDLASNYGVALPNAGDLSELPMDVARKWIDELQAKRGAAELEGWNNGSATEPAAPLVTTDTDLPREETAAPIAAAQSARPASANQLATIAKLSRILGVHDVGYDGMPSSEASEIITGLSRQYNERNAQQNRRSA
jgi:hypothetical protein